MLGKLTLAGAVLISGVALAAIDLRQLYDEMYPVNTLKRDAFGICRDSDPSFVRARQDDRDGCFDRMPHDFALAIGWERPRSRLAALNVRPGGFPTAEELLAGAEWTIPAGGAGPRRFTGLPRAGDGECDAAPRQFAGAMPPPGIGPAPLPAKDRLAAGGRAKQNPAVSVLGLGPRGTRPAGKGERAPVLPLSAAGAAVSSFESADIEGVRGVGAALFDAEPSADLGDVLSFTLAPSPASRCRTPA